jgi:hypothetical protein
MKRILVSIAMVVLVAATVAGGEEAGATYGDGVTIEDPVPISRLLGEPETFVGQKVRVDGVITGVCKKRGCWIQVTDPDTGEGIRIKVEDGVIVFPYSAMGEPVSAEGIFEAVPLTPEQAAARSGQEQQPASHSHPPGEPCDKGLPAKTGCDVPVQNNTVYLIRGTGAVIHS